MSAFKCEKCGCVENTATSNYWSQKYPFQVTEEKPFPADVNSEKPKLCSECDPDIGKWHGCFPKESAKGLMLGEDGFLYDKEQKVKHTKIVGEIKE